MATRRFGFSQTNNVATHPAGVTGLGGNEADGSPFTAAVYPNGGVGAGALNPYALPANSWGTTPHARFRGDWQFSNDVGGEQRVVADLAAGEYDIYLAFGKVFGGLYSARARWYAADGTPLTPLVAASANDEAAVMDAYGNKWAPGDWAANQQPRRITHAGGVIYFEGGGGGGSGTCGLVVLDYVQVGGGVTVTGVNFAAASLALALGGAARANVATAQATGGQAPAPSYSSATPSVATVDPATGAVTPVGVGTSVITAAAGGVTTTYLVTVGTLTAFAIGPKPGPVIAEGATQDFMVSQNGTVPAGLFDVVVQGGTYDRLDASTIRVEKNSDPVYSVTVTSQLKPALHDTVIGTLPGIIPEPVLGVKFGVTPLVSGADFPVTLQAGGAPFHLFLGVSNAMPGADTEALVGLAAAWLDWPAPAWATGTLDSPVPAAQCDLALAPPSAEGPLAPRTLRFSSTRAGVAPFDLRLVPTVAPAAVGTAFTTGHALQLAQTVAGQERLEQMVSHLFNNAVPKPELVQAAADEVATRQLGVKSESVNAIANQARTVLQPDVQSVGEKADDAAAAATTAAARAEEARARAAQLPELTDIRGDVERAGGPLQATKTAAQAAATPTAVAAALEAAFADAQIALDPAARIALAGDVVARLQATEGWAATDLAAEDLDACTVQPLAKVLPGGGAGHQLLYTHPTRGLVKVTAVLAGVAPDPAGVA